MVTSDPTGTRKRVPLSGEGKEGDRAISAFEAKDDHDLDQTGIGSGEKRSHMVLVLSPP